MNLQSSRTHWCLTLLVAVLGTSSGCRSTSGGKWNPTTWFAKREPDASMIAGRSGAPQLPTSPALNHNPTALANNYGASPGGTSSSLAADSSVNRAATPGAGVSPLAGSPSFAASTPPGSPPPAAGLAARSNGYTSGSYQTGPYGMTTPSADQPAMGTPPSFQTMPASTSSLVTTPNVHQDPSTGFPNPYGGSYNPVPNQMAAGPASSHPHSGLPGTSSFANTAGSAPTMPDSGLPDYPSIPGLPAIPVSGTSSGGTSPTTPPASAYQPASSPGSYSPGTTGRNTSYNFGIGGTGAVPSASSTGLPPNTATGNSPLLR